jgi:acyl-CoA thioesterase-1
LCLLLLLLLTIFLMPPALYGAGYGAGSQSAPRNILIVGDSISAAYGMSLDEGWVALLARRLEREYPRYAVVNASISGETSAGAASRLPGLLREHEPSVVVLELGGNDGLRGYPIKRFRENMARMLNQSQDSGARLLLLGMEIPPNYGARYTDMFRRSYTELASDSGAALVPFLLEGVATNPGLMQGDRIHPSVQAQHLLLDTMWPFLEKLLDE